MTIRPLSHIDVSQFDDFCEREPVRSLVIRLNIESYGYCSRTVRSWGVFETTPARLSGVLLHFGNTVVVADSQGECADSFAKIVDTVRDVKGIRGSAAAVAALPQYLKNYTAVSMQNSLFLRLQRAPNCDRVSLANVRRAEYDDLNKLEILYSSSDDMFRDRSNLSKKLRDSRVWVAEVCDPNLKPRVVSAALLNVEGSSAALIGGVYTLPGYRCRGYAGACTAALSLEVQSEGKVPILFYENPAAGKIYRSLGFEEIDSWRLMYLKRGRNS